MTRLFVSWASLNPTRPPWISIGILPPTRTQPSWGVNTATSWLVRKKQLSCHLTSEVFSKLACYLFNFFCTSAVLLLTAFALFTYKTFSCWDKKGTRTPTLRHLPQSFVSSPTAGSCSAFQSRWQGAVFTLENDIPGAESQSSRGKTLLEVSVLHLVVRRMLPQMDLLNHSALPSQLINKYIAPFFVGQ